MQALEQFESTLKKEPRRFRSLLRSGHAAQLSGSAIRVVSIFASCEGLCSRRQACKIRTRRGGTGDFAEIGANRFFDRPSFADLPDKQTLATVG